MSEVLQRRPYQVKGSEFILRCKRGNIWADMGLGKTIMGLWAARTLKLLGDTPVLVIAPLRVAKHTWPAEQKRWDAFSDLSVQPIVGTEKQRVKAFFTDADVYTINYENMMWLQRISNGKFKFRSIIADESTRLKGFRLRRGTRNSRALSKMAFKAKRFINMTGTPCANGVEDLWGQQYFIDCGERLGRTFGAFRARWFDTRTFGAPGQGWTKYSLKKGAYAEICDILSDCTLTIKHEDYFDLKKPIVSTVKAYLPPKARGIYTEMEKHLFAEMSQGDVDAVNAAVKTNKCLQIANGAVFLTDQGKKWEEVHTAKLEALDSLMNELGGENVMVAYHFRPDRERLLKHFSYAEALDDTPDALDRWNNGEIKMLLVHPQSAGHGLNFQYGGRTLVFFAHWWSPEHRQQVIERIGPVRQMQAGFNRSVLIYNIVAVDTIDETILDSHANKQSVQEAIVQRMNRK